MRPEVAVVILNWNGAQLLPECLSALAAQTYRDFELWLVDNGSIDGSEALLEDLQRTQQPAWLAAKLPRPARIIRNTDNVGFAAGNNQAIRIADTPYVATLNNDAIAEPEWLGRLVQTARGSGPAAGMVSSTMLFANRPTTVASAGISMHRDGLALDRGLGLPSANFEYVGVRPVFGPSAGAALYRTGTLRDTGLFDERYFSYLEDADLAWRARWRGWRALHDPLARVTHVYSATGGQESAFKRMHIARNRVWTIYKNMPEALLVRCLPAVLRYDLLVMLRGLLANDRASMQGRIEGWRTLARFTEDRRKITTSARVHPSEMLDFLAPPLSPRQALKYRKRLNYLLDRDPESPKGKLGIEKGPVRSQAPSPRSDR